MIRFYVVRRVLLPEIERNCAGKEGSSLVIQFHVVRHVIMQLCRRPEPYEILTGSKSGVSE